MNYTKEIQEKIDEFRPEDTVQEIHLTLNDILVAVNKYRLNKLEITDLTKTLTRVGIFADSNGISDNENSDQIMAVVYCRHDVTEK